MKHAMNPTRLVTLCDLDPSGLELAQALVDADCEICSANIRPYHLVHLRVGENTVACGEQMPETATNSPLDTNCKACLESAQEAAKPTFHIANVLGERTECGVLIESGVVVVPPTDSDCATCQEAYRRTAVHIVDVGAAATICGSPTEAQTLRAQPSAANCAFCLDTFNTEQKIRPHTEHLVSATNPFDIVSVTLDGARFTFQRDSMVSVADFMTPDGALEHHTNVTGWLRAQGWKDVIRAHTYEPHANQAAVSSFGDPVSLLREWFTHWNQDGDAPTKLPNSLHTRTAGFLAVCDKG